MLQEGDMQKLENIFSQYNEIKAAYLFGSYAENKENKYSDLDIALVVEDNSDKMMKLDILTELTKNNFTNVDLVILNSASLLINFEAVKYNKLIYKREDFNAPEFFSFTIRRYLDFRPYLEVQRKYLKERILNG